MEAVGPHVGLLWLQIKLQIVELVISSAISLIAIVTNQTISMNVKVQRK